MVTGEPIPVEKTAAEQGDRRHGQRHGHVRDGGPARRQRHAARADRPAGRRGAAVACADSAAGRHRRRLVRPARDSGRRRHVRRLGHLGAGAAPGARPRERRRGADHRVPVCPRPCHADVHHGRHRPRRRTGRAAPQRRGARGDGAGRHGRRGQDRHPDRGQAGAHHGRRRGLASTSRRCSASWPASSGSASIRWPRRSCAGPKNAASQTVAGGRLPIRDRQGRRRRGRRTHGGDRQHGDAGRGGRDRRRRRRAPTNCAATARP